MRLAYYSMYPKDFDSDDLVRSMEDCELGLYLRCLNHAWINDGLPADPEEIRRRFRDDPDAFSKKWERVKLCFPLSSEGKRRNPRQEKERAEAEEKYKKRVKRSKKGAKARWHSNASSMLEAMPKASLLDASASGSGSGSISRNLNLEKGEC